MSGPAPITLLADAEHAAVLIMLLEEAQAAEMLRQLGPAELRVLGEKMCALGDIGPQQITEAISGFVRSSEGQGISARGRNGQVRALLTRAVGSLKADNLMQRILPQGEATGPAIELARWLMPAALIALIRDEHPQAIALLLVQLEPDVAAEVLHSLPADQQTQVVHRVATLGPVSSDALAMLERVLEQRVNACHGMTTQSLGGPREAAEIINNAGKNAEKRILPELGKIDKALSRAIENEMFKFEHLFSLDSQAMGALLREVESETLIDALKGTAEEHREIFFNAMSRRAADGVKDEIAARGRLKVSEVVEAQKAIITVARRLAGDGTIILGPGGGDDEYV